MSSNGTVAAAGEPDYNYLNAGKKTYLPEVITFSNSGSSWSYSKTISTPDGNTLDGFGQGALSLDSTGAHLLVGAQKVNYYQSKNVQGLAFLYTYASGSWGTPKAFFNAATSANCGCQLGYAGALASDASAVIRHTTSGLTWAGAAYAW